jgi:hypothetical protein
LEELGWVLGRNRKTGIGLENDRNSATMGCISAAFLNDTVSVSFFFFFFFSLL